MEIVEDFDEKSYNNNGKPQKSSRILRVNPNFFIFLSLFIIFLHFAFFFIISFFLHFSSCFFIFHFFSFVFLFLFWDARNPIFLASIASRFLVTFLKKKNSF